MRGADTFTESLFTTRKLEDFVPARHPLREIRKMANATPEQKVGVKQKSEQKSGWSRVEQKSGSGLKSRGHKSPKIGVLHCNSTDQSVLGRCPSTER